MQQSQRILAGGADDDQAHPHPTAVTATATATASGKALLTLAPKAFPSISFSKRFLRRTGEVIVRLTLTLLSHTISCTSITHYHHFFTPYHHALPLCYTNTPSLSTNSCYHHPHILVNTQHNITATTSPNIYYAPKPTHVSHIQVIRLTVHTTIILDDSGRPTRIFSTLKKTGQAGDPPPAQPMLLYIPLPLPPYPPPTHTHTHTPLSHDDTTLLLLSTNRK